MLVNVLYSNLRLALVLLCYYNKISLYTINPIEISHVLN